MNHKQIKLISEVNEELEMALLAIEKQCSLDVIKEWIERAQNGLDKMYDTINEAK